MYGLFVRVTALRKTTLKVEKREKHVIALEMAISKEIAIPQLLGTFYKRYHF